jgi:hypothetical protein
MSVSGLKATHVASSKKVSATISTTGGIPSSGMLPK